MKPDRDELRLQLVIESIEKITLWISGQTSTSFSKEKNEILFDAVLMKLIFIGELCSKTTAETQNNNPKIPWRQLKDLRNVIAHEYLGVDSTQIFVMATSELPKLISILKESIS